MRSMFIACLLAALVYAPENLFAQKMVLVCPFEHGSGREPKEAFTWDPPDHKVIMISTQDSLIRSVVSGEVVKVQANEENKYEVVLFYNDHYFWYNNVTRPRVTRLQKVVAGQTIGIYTFGDELELRVYKEPKKSDPEMIDPREMLECKIPKAQ